MIIHLIYWQSLCKQLIRQGERRQRKQHSSEEERAFDRSLNRHQGKRFIRIS
jgi:hypothetical protein